MVDHGIEAVKERVDIVDLIGEQVRLQKAGKTFKGLCPFHSERTPSFVVNPDRQTWHCFGSCGTGGDIFEFVKKRDSVDFGEALRTLAERAGVSLAPAASPEAVQANERLYAANEAAVVFFQQALRGNAVGVDARAYVAGRGLDAATIDAFEIGFAPDGWDHLRTFLHGKGFTDGEMTDAGLLSAGESGNVYDRFRRRLIFPIRDERGRAAGFGGRALDDAKPKYLNTPQTPLFDKGRLLYLLHRAKESVRSAGNAVLVEGYLDAITAHQFGYTNVVATLGTALTERHVQLLRRFTPRVTLAMDADAAGLEAAQRGEEVVRNATIDDESRSQMLVAWDGLVRIQALAPVEVRVFTVPNGKDPDEAIREQPSRWQQWVDGAMPPFEFRLLHETARTDMDNPRARVELADRMLPLLLQIGDRTLQASYVDKLAERAKVPATTLTARLHDLVPRKDLGQRVAERQRVSRETATAPVVGGLVEKIEGAALALLVRYPCLREFGEALEPTLFQQSVYRQIFATWLLLPAPHVLEETALPEELRGAFAAITALRLPPYDDESAESALLDTVQKLRLRLLNDQKRLMAAEVAELQTGVDQAAVVGLNLRLLQNSDPAEADTAATESVVTLATHLRDDEYLMREMHALEWEKRTHRAPRWAIADGSESNN